MSASKAHAWLGEERASQRGLLMVMMVRFTHQLGKTFPREDVHPAGIGALLAYTVVQEVEDTKRQSPSSTAGAFWSGGLTGGTGHFARLGAAVSDR